ncbi:hypothetical protein CEXT_728681 [Caerostris extrusa]|uniref:Uncharacterized protein n=1 Tax=Caerostris extrusa TaxID=172846 RepID=A0AAV4Y962_CAEEX|nr:hypothetical protein CEXT_728681 [Caerostris extrusa]
MHALYSRLIAGDSELRQQKTFDEGSAPDGRAEAEGSVSCHGQKICPSFENPHPLWRVMNGRPPRGRWSANERRIRPAPLSTGKLHNTLPVSRNENSKAILSL